MKKILLLTIVFLITSVSFAEGKYIGNIKKLKGDVTIVRGSETLKAEAGTRLEEGDLIKTGENSGAGIIFKDSTLITVGPGSQLFLNKYVFQPKNSNYEFNVFMKKGSAVYNSGRMGKLSPKSVKFRTPKATVGIRGTKFFIKVD